MKTLTLLATALLAGDLLYAQMPAMVQDIRPGLYGSDPVGMLTWRDKMYFIASDSAHGNEIWSYDETGPAQILFDFNPGKNNGVAAIGVYQDKLLFSGDTGSGYELYSYDGTNKPVKLTSIWANSGAPSWFTVAGNTLYFAATHYKPNVPNPWRVTDLFYYNGTDTPKFYTPTVSSTFGLMPEWLIAHNNKLYFSGAVTTSGPIRKIHEVDPATGNVRILDSVAGTSDKFYGLTDPLILSGKLYFTGYQYRHTASNKDSTTFASELYCLDGGVVRRLTYLSPGPVYPGVCAFTGAFKGDVYFGGIEPDSTVQLYSYNPSTNAVSRSCTINPTKVVSGAGSVRDMIEYGSKLYFVTGSASYGPELWSYDYDGCGMVMDIFPGRRGSIGDPDFFIYKDHLYFHASDSVHGTELWRIEGSTGIKNITWDGTVTVYPNPAQGDVTLSVNSKRSERLKVSILDVTGKNILERTWDIQANRGETITLPVRSLAAGPYFYQIHDLQGRRLASGRFIRD